MKKIERIKERDYGDLETKEFKEEYISNYDLSKSRF